MKSIYNWDKATVCDIEADNLLDEATTVHVLSYKLNGGEVSSLNGVKEKGRIAKFFKHHIDNKIPIVGHNFINYDVPLIEKIYRLDLSDLMVIDTLPLSWYLNIDRKTHGLDSFLQDYGVKKPEIDDWESLSYEEYKHRCQEDVKINHFLWEDFKARLIDMYSLSKVEIDSGEVGGKRVSRDEVIFIDSLKGLSVEEHINRILTFLMFQADVSRLQEEVGWLVDEEMVKEEGKRLEGLLEEATKELESVMPKVPKYVKRTPPKNPYKKSGELSASGQAWEDRKRKIGVLNEHGHPLSEVREAGYIHELVRYDPPNIDSHDQVKSFLFSKGWRPQTFKYVRDNEAFEEWIKSKPEEGSPRGAWQAWSASRPEDRAIPQINMEDEDRNKELCDSVVDLIEEVPEIKALANYSVISHRYRFLTGKSGIVNNIDGNGRVKARMGGLTNTLRWKHAGLVNLPKSDKPFSSSIRGCLIAGEGNISIGSDISSLEDVIKIHFMIAHDPEHVKTMSEEGYDPHLQTAVASGFITEEDMEKYKRGEGDSEWRSWVASRRSIGKTLNYALIYGSGVKTIVRSTGLSVEEATAGREGYWELNKSIISIAEEQRIIGCSKGRKWLVNPINGFLYNIRSEKDIFSTLAQGSGSFMFHMWLDSILTKMENRWGKKSITAQFHDELVIVCKNNQKAIKEICKMIKDSIKEVSEKFMLRRHLDCDVQTGYRYSDIH